MSLRHLSLTKPSLLPRRWAGNGVITEDSEMERLHSSSWALVSRAAQKRLRSQLSTFGWPDRNPLIRKKRHSTLTRVWGNTPKGQIKQKQHKQSAHATESPMLTSCEFAQSLFYHTNVFPNDALCEIRINGSHRVENDREACVCVLGGKAVCWWHLSAQPVTDRESEKFAQWDMAPWCLLRWIPGDSSQLRLLSEPKTPSNFFFFWVPEVRKSYNVGILFPFTS